MEIIFNRHAKVSRNKTTANTHGLIQVCCPHLIKAEEKKKKTVKGSELLFTNYLLI